MIASIEAFLIDETGAVAIEYALIAVIISIAIYSAVAKSAPFINSILNTISATLFAAAAAK